MEHTTHMTFCDRKLQEGAAQLTAAVRSLVAHAEPELYDHIAEAPDDVFLEPLLFAYFSCPQPHLPLGQLLLGALPSELRPDALAVRTDPSGRLYIPHLGYFTTRQPLAELTLELSGSPEAYTLRDASGCAVAHVYEPVCLVDGTAIEILRYDHPLLTPLFYRADGQRAPATLGDAPSTHGAHISRAFAHIEAVDPALAAQMRRSVRLIVPFRAPDVRSFATIAAHGAAFFSTEPQVDEVYFIDDMLHQCSHVIFNTMTARRRDFLHVDPDMRMDGLRGVTDGRSVYGALHGLFGEYHMCRVMQQLDQARVFQGRAAHELLGRLAFIGQKYLMDTVNLDFDLYAPDGRVCFETLKTAGHELKRTRPDLWEFDLSRMGYVFDYTLFAEGRTP